MGKKIGKSYRENKKCVVEILEAADTQIIARREVKSHSPHTNKKA